MTKTIGTKRRKVSDVSNEIAEVTRPLPVSTKVKKHKAKTISDSIKLEEEAKKLLESMPISPDEHGFMKEYTLMLRLNARLIRKLRRQLLDDEKLNNRDIYSLSTLMSQQREVIADIRMISDLSGQVQLILELVLQPMLSNIGQVIVNSFYQQRRLIMETVKEKETQFALKKLDEITGEVSRAMQIYYEQGAAKVQEILVGEEPTKKKRK